MHRGELLRVVTRGVVGLTVPSVAVANLLCELGLDDITDGEVQGLSARASFSRSGVVGIGSRSVVLGTMPSVGVAGGRRNLYILAVVDSEV